MVNDVFRKAQMVKRPLGAWSPAIHQMLNWLHDHDFDTVPKLIQVTEDSEILSYIEGESILRPWSDVVRQDQWIVQLGQWLRKFQDTAKDFRLNNSAKFIWGTHEPDDHMVVSHGDLGLWNCIHQNGMLKGVIDWDLARYGQPLDDLAYIAIEGVPLRNIVKAAHGHEVDDTVLYSRLKALCTGYGDCTPKELIEHAANYLEIVAQETVDLAEQGVHPFVSFADRDFFNRYQADIQYIREHWLNHPLVQ